MGGVGAAPGSGQGSHAVLVEEGFDQVGLIPGEALRLVLRQFLELHREENTGPTAVANE